MNKRLGEQLIAIAHNKGFCFFTLCGWSRDLNDAILLEEHEMNVIDWLAAGSTNPEGKIEIWKLSKFIACLRGEQHSYEWLVST